MKNNILIIGLLGMLGFSVGVTSCAPDYETDFKVEKLVVPDKSMAAHVFPISGGTHEIAVQTNVPFGRWTAKSNAEWCTVVPHEDKVVVSAAANDIYKQRKAEVVISYGHQSYSIDISQFGLEPQIMVGPDSQNEGFIANVEPEMTSYRLPVTTNLDIDNVVVPDTCSWVHFSKEPATFQLKRDADEIKEYELVFTLDQNTDTIQRYCTVILQSSQNYNYTSSFVIKQLKRGYIVEIDDDHKVFEVKAMGETITVPFKVNGPTEAYTFEILGDAKNWIKSVPAARALRDASETFMIEPNIEKVESPRSGEIKFTSTDPNEPNSFIVTVNQAGFIPTPPKNVETPTFTAKPGQILLQWTVPAEVDYTKLKISYYDKVLKEDKEITINDYKVNSVLVGDTYQCAGEYEFTFTTYGPTGMETQTPVSLKATSGEASERERVELTIDMLSANATQVGDGGGLPALIDNNINTHYHSIWSKPVGEYHYLQIKLNAPLQTLCFEYYARKGNVNNGGDVVTAEVMGSSNGSYWESMGNEEFNLPTTNGGLGTAKNYVQGRSAYTYIRFIPKATRQNNPLNPSTKQAWFNMSELQLYRIRHDEDWAKEQLGI